MGNSWGVEMMNLDECFVQFMNLMKLESFGKRRVSIIQVKIIITGIHYNRNWRVNFHTVSYLRCMTGKLSWTRWNGGYAQDDTGSSLNGDWIVPKLHGHQRAQEHSARWCLRGSREIQCILTVSSSIAWKQHDSRYCRMMTSKSRSSWRILHPIFKDVLERWNILQITKVYAISSYDA